MVKPYAIPGFWLVVFGFLLLIVRYPKFFINRPTYIGFHTLSLGVFIIYMYESGEYTNDDVHKIRKKTGNKCDKSSSRHQHIDVSFVLYSLKNIQRGETVMLVS